MNQRFYWIVYSHHHDKFLKVFYGNCNENKEKIHNVHMYFRFSDIQKFICALEDRSSMRVNMPKFEDLDQTLQNVGILSMPDVLTK